MRKLEGGPHPDVRGSQPSKKATFGPPGGGGQSPGTPYSIKHKSSSCQVKLNFLLLDLLNLIIKLLTGN